MGGDNKKANDWPVILFILIVPVVFFFGGMWIGIPALIIGVVALGWSKRHKGPFPTNKSRD